MQGLLHQLEKHYVLKFKKLLSSIFQMIKFDWLAEIMILFINKKYLTKQDVFVKH